MRPGAAFDPVTDEVCREEFGKAFARMRDAGTRARHCEQAAAGYFYCQATENDPCGPGRYPHDGHNGSCATIAR
jgi:hypothetical protein